MDIIWAVVVLAWENYCDNYLKQSAGHRAQVEMRNSRGQSTYHLSCVEGGSAVDNIDL